MERREEGERDDLPEKRFFFSTVSALWRRVAGEQRESRELREFRGQRVQQTQGLG
jgi:hypothetical protein